MNWKQEAKERLSQLTALQNACRSLPVQIKHLEYEISRARSASFEPVAGKGCYGRGDDRLLDNIVRRQELCWALKRTRSRVRLIKMALDKLDPQEQMILQKFYVNPEDKPMERLCQELKIEKSSIYRYRDRALERFTMTFYGIPEEA